MEEGWTVEGNEKGTEMGKIMKEMSRNKCCASHNYQLSK